MQAGGCKMFAKCLGNALAKNKGKASRYFGRQAGPGAGQLFPWTPVYLGIGIAGYFSLRQEPSALQLSAAAGLGIALAVYALVTTRRIGPLIWALSLICLGFAVTGGRAHQVAGPVLKHRYHGPVIGRIAAIDRSRSDSLRLTLDRVYLPRVPPDLVPRRVRVALRGQRSHFVPKPGQVVMLTGHLAPPQGPVEPGGFDFRRHAWFLQLGAVGYTRSPAMLWRAAPSGGALAVYRFRMQLSRAVQMRLPGRVGGFAAAILTGDRSSLRESTLESLRVANLSHLLAISGLHMGLLVGFVFNSVRGVLALIPWAVLHLPLKKIAAVIALGSASAYLLLSGASVATERAFIMAAVVLGAVLIDRRAISLRAVALAATVVLILRPESLLSPGFQMSFAATTALVAAFGVFRDWQLARAETSGRLPRWVTGLAGLTLSSAVAGLATAPIAAAYFNQIAQFGLLANLISVPVMGLIVMPGAVVATCLTPLGLADIGLWGMRLGISWILTVADRIAAWDGARIMTPSPGPLILPLLYLGALTSMFCTRYLRWAGLAMQAVALSLWMGQGRPPVLVSQSGKLIGVLGPEGRVLSRSRGEGFSARVWLDSDGDPATQAHSAIRPNAVGIPVRYLPEKTDHEDVRRVCRIARAVVTPARIPGVDIPGCLVLDATRLAESGAVALYPVEGGLRMVSVAHIAGNRLWTMRNSQ